MIVYLCELDLINSFRRHITTKVEVYNVNNFFTAVRNDRHFKTVLLTSSRICLFYLTVFRVLFSLLPALVHLLFFFLFFLLLMLHRRFYFQVVQLLLIQDPVIGYLEQLGKRRLARLVEFPVEVLEYLFPKRALLVRKEHYFSRAPKLVADVPTACHQVALRNRRVKTNSPWMELFRFLVFFSTAVCVRFVVRLGVFFLLGNLFLFFARCLSLCLSLFFTLFSEFEFLLFSFFLFFLFAFQLF